MWTQSIMFITHNITIVPEIYNSYCVHRGHNLIIGFIHTDSKNI